MKYKTVRYLSILLFVLQLVGIGIWFYVEQPEMSTLWATLEIALFLVGINLITGFLLYILKKKDLAKLFLGNSIICPFTFFGYWIVWFMYYAK